MEEKTSENASKIKESSITIQPLLWLTSFLIFKKMKKNVFHHNMKNQKTLL